MRQKDFARRDYEGLTEENAAKLRAERSRIAENLRKKVRYNKSVFGPMASEPGNIHKLNISNAQDKKNAIIESNQIRNDLLNSQTVNNPKTNSIKTGIESIQKSGQEKLAKSNFLGRVSPKAALGIGGAAIVAGYGAKKLYDKKNQK